jgi:hypothetical protein
MLAEHIAQPEINHADIVISIEKNVFTLQIAVRNPLLVVKIIEDGNHLSEVAARLVLAQATVFVDIFEKIAILDIFHNQIIVLGILTAHIKLGDKRMAHLLEQSDFALQASPGERGVDRGFENSFDRDLAVRGKVEPLPNGGKGAKADALVEDEGAEARAGHDLIHRLFLSRLKVFSKFGSDA